MSSRVADEPLRVRALEVLGPLGDELARVALGAGEILVEHDMRGWEGTSGTMRGHRVVVLLEHELLLRVESSHAARDGLLAALSAAMAERPGQSVADLRLEEGAGPRSQGPYRDPRARG